jgi:ligand-binding sensor domain-containing protein/signal transduction histidine kinase
VRPATHLCLVRPLIVAVGFLLIGGTRCVALDPNRSLRELGHQIWMTESGLPQNTVQSITQTRDGYIWIATQEGLARFDGVNFAIFNKENTPQLKSNDIRFLREDSQGGLWISTSYGLIRRQNDQFTTFTVSEGLPDNSVGQIVEDRKPSLWIATAAGLVRYESGSFKTYTTRQGLASDVIQTLFARADGSLLVSTAAGIQLLKDEKITDWVTPEELKTRTVTTIAEGREGQLWFGTLDGLFEHKAGRAVTLTSDVGLPDNRITSLLVDRQGLLWIGTSGGVARLRNSQLDTFTAALGLSSNLVLSIFEDREGSVWVGTEAGGLNLIKSKKFTTFTTKEGLPNDLVKVIYQDASGGIWVGSNGGGLTLLKDGKFTTWTTRDGLASDVVLSIAGDGAGNLWVGTPDGLNVFRNGKFTTFTFADGLSNDFVRSVYVDRSGALWIGTREGLNRFADNRFSTFTTKDGLANDFIGALYEDSKGNLWIGTLAGLSRFKDGNFKSFSTNDGLSSNTVISLYEDKEGDLWIGTNGGSLNRLRGDKFDSFTSRNGLSADVIYRILEDQQRNLWFSSNKGVFRVNKDELEKVAKSEIASVHPVFYGPADGTLTRECSGGGHPAGWKTADGRLWFATIKGIAVIDPANIPLNTVPPPTVIEQVLIDNQTASMGVPLNFPAGSTRFDFYYTAPSFIAPDNIRFKYKLEGFDGDWIDGGARRVANYTNLRPGNYRFRVIAANNDGIWNEQGTLVDFYLEPRFYQTYWFLILCALLFAGVAWQLYRMRVRQMSSQFGAVLAERNRIAREIHDNLAQDILGISVQLELVARLMPTAGEKAKTHLDRARILIRNSMAEARRYVWDLRSQESQTRDLPTALSDVTRRLTADNEVQSVVQVTGAFRPLPSLIESNLLRIGQEAINNAIKHAQAQRILIDLNFDTNAVRLSIRDDGQGFDLGAEHTDGHFGLIGMRERAAQIGGKLSINSEKGTGTEVIIEVPIDD